MNGSPLDAGPRKASVRGFTLTELLVVMAILVALGGLGFVGVSRMLRRGDERATEAMIQQIATRIQAYERRPENGDFPPTLLDDSVMPGFGASSNFENCGIESVVICLSKKGASWAVGIEEITGGGQDSYDNLDQDQTQRPLTVFSDTQKDLFEVLDRWGTPLAYFHWRDYDQVESRNLDRITSAEGESLRVKPWRNPKTKDWFEKRGFQIISAGRDGVFNTDDDVTNFQR